MKASEFIDRIEEAKIVEAIRHAEKLTSGELRIFISSRKQPEVLKAAEEKFEKLGMTKTRERNGILIYFAPASKNFAVVGDKGIHEKCGPVFWSAIADEMSRLLKDEAFTDAILHAIATTGQLLCEHFPRGDHDQNELSDEIGRD
ncbi:MAG: hypothetical protein JWM04_2720 [Verrucomicrobiales bacterium]|nr:hypothetical protein [Verrucomicrobiales bacterium]